MHSGVRVVELGTTAPVGTSVTVMLLDREALIFLSSLFLGCHNYIFFLKMHHIWLVLRAVYSDSGSVLRPRFLDGIGGSSASL